MWWVISGAVLTCFVWQPWWHQLQAQAQQHTPLTTFASTLLEAASGVLISVTAAADGIMLPSAPAAVGHPSRQQPCQPWGPSSAASSNSIS